MTTRAWFTTSNATASDRRNLINLNRRLLRPIGQPTVRTHMIKPTAPRLSAAGGFFACHCRPTGIPFGMPSGAHSSDADLKSLSQFAYDSIREIILSGVIRPGERLSERDLARRIQVSRTPLREALSRLEHDGLAVSRPGRGYFAQEFDPEHVAELYEFREILETSACRLAADRINAKAIAELQDVIRQLARFEVMPTLTPDEIHSEVELALSLHEIIARECGNSRICHALLQIYGQLRLLTWIDVLWFDQWSVTRQEHRDLVAAVVNGNGALAAEVTTRHIQRCRDGALRVANAQYKEKDNGVYCANVHPTVDSLD